VQLDRDKSANTAVFLAGCLWGTFWFPIRRIEAAGIVDGWVSLALFVPLTLILIPFAIANWQRLFANWGTLLPAGLLIGVAFAFYSTALLLTDVLRVIVLFYLTPVWGTLLSWFFQQQAITLPRALALVLGLVGLIVILGIDEGVPLPRNLGDWMALLAGIIWAAGTLVLHQGKSQHPTDTVFSFCLAGTLVAALLLIIPLEGHQQPPSFQALQRGWIWITALALIFTLPVMWLLLWAATFLDPGRVGLLLLSEVVVGVITAALWAGEPFGASELIGAALITCAGLAEVVGQRKPPRPPIDSQCSTRI